MPKEMPCGKEKVVRYSARAWPVFTQRLKDGALSGFPEVDIEIPQSLRPKFEKMCAFFINKQVPAEAVPQHMLDYLWHTGRARNSLFQSRCLELNLDPVFGGNEARPAAVHAFNRKP